MSDKIPGSGWSSSEETEFMLAREMEWAEAFAENHPQCRIGQIYLDFLRREIMTTRTD